jgi:hypothetical protein
MMGKQTVSANEYLENECELGDSAMHILLVKKIKFRSTLNHPCISEMTKHGSRGCIQLFQTVAHDKNIDQSLSYK